MKRSRTEENKESNEMKTLENERSEFFFSSFCRSPFQKKKKNVES